jgi:hypothetical protein
MGLVLSRKQLKGMRPQSGQLGQQGVAIAFIFKFRGSRISRFAAAIPIAME